MTDTKTDARPTPDTKQAIAIDAVEAFRVALEAAEDANRAASRLSARDGRRTLEALVIASRGLMPPMPSDIMGTAIAEAKAEALNTDALVSLRAAIDAIRAMGLPL